jgi:hypothetical protein
LEVHVLAVISALWHGVCTHSVMSTTSKSPKQVAAAAYRVARDTLPEYNSRYSPKKFTQPQLFVCLVLKIFFKTDYRGIVQILNDLPSICKVIELQQIPHFTTLQKASKRLLKSSLADQLLDKTVTTMNNDKKITLAAVDSTGLQAGHISRYFVRRKRSKQLETYENTHYRRWPKLALSCDCSNHLVLSAITVRGPGVDVNHFERIVTPAAEEYCIECILADAGYDSESNHRFARECHNIETIIPPNHGRPTLTSKSFNGKYRELMRTAFDKETYGQRWQVETVMSMIKRNQGEELRARSYWSQNREMMLKVLTHNIAIILSRLKELFYRAGQTPF